jgi:hypothetical protein
MRRALERFVMTHDDQNMGLGLAEMEHHEERKEWDSRPPTAERHGRTCAAPGCGARTGAIAAALWREAAAYM